MPPATWLVIYLLCGTAIIAVFVCWRWRAPTWLASLVLAGILTVLSIFVTHDIAHDREALKNVRFGWPSPYFVQNQERYEPPFPWAMQFAWEPSGTPEYPVFGIEPAKLAASLGVNWILSGLIWGIVNWLRVRRRHF